MMRSLLTLAVVVAFSTIGCAQGLLPVSVQQFMTERECRQRLSNLKVDDRNAYRYVASHDVNGREKVDAFVGIDNELVLPLLEQMGVDVGCVFDGFITAQVPVDCLEKVCRIYGVNDLEISQNLTLCTDTTMSLTHVNKVLDGLNHRLPKNYDGTGVIVAVIDRGFDYQHRAFMSNENHSVNRISRVYSTSLTNGHPARYNKTLNLRGSVFMGRQIYSLTTDEQNATHGTHTASIAAGSHVGGYGGMAPGAEIVLCSAKNLDIYMSAVEVTDCVRYIDSYADSVGKPCVMSLSVSTSNGPHDGNDYLSRAVKQICGPGRIFVIAASNNAGRLAYTHKSATADKPLNMLFKMKSSNSADSSYFYTSLLADVWMRKTSQLFYYKFHILDQWLNRIVWESEQFSAKTRITTSEFGNYFTFDPTRDTVGYIETNTGSSYGKYKLEISLHNLLNKAYRTENGLKCGRYAIGMSIYPRKEISSDIDAWTCNTGSGFSSVRDAVTLIDGSMVNHFYAFPSDSCSIGTYAVGDSTISAGAYAGRNSFYSMASGSIVMDNTVTIGDIANFSSYQPLGVGPTGKALPTICAPGVMVVAAGSRYSSFARGSSSTVMTVDGSYWGALTGTSMAAPTVAGIIALWLQANPNLSVADINKIIADSAIKDMFTHGVNGAHFGPNGKIDAYAGMQLVLMRLGFKQGDVNNDGIVDILDVSLLISYILGSLDEGTDFNVMAADIDSDGVLSVRDVVTLIARILNE